MSAANGLSFLPGALLRWLFISPAPLHLPEDTFALHFFLERAKRLIDVIVANKYLNQNGLLPADRARLRAEK